MRPAQRRCEEWRGLDIEALRNGPLHTARISRCALIGRDHGFARFVVPQPKLGADGLREQPIADRHIEPDRAREERLAAHAHHVFDRRFRALAPADDQSDIEDLGRGPHGAQAQAGQARVGTFDFIA